MSKQKTNKIKNPGELIIADKELSQNDEKDTCEEDLVIANKKLVYKNIEKEKDTTELIIANNELKKAKRKIIAGEKQFRHTLDHMLEGVQIHDFNWRYIYANDALVKRSKYSREELLGHTLMEKYPGLEQTNLFKVLQRCMTERVAQHLETEFVFPDGRKTDFELSIQPTPEGIFILSIDITDRKKGVEDLRKSELRLNEAQAIAHIGNWEIDFTRKLQTWSDEFYRIYGISKGEVQPSTELFLSFMHPEDAGFTRKKVQEAFDSLKDSSFNFRFIRKDGITRYGYADWRFESDKKGNLVRLFGVMQDITERKEAEEAIRKSNERYEFVNKATQDTIWEWDYSTQKGKWGEGIITVFGYSADKLNYGDNWVNEYVHPGDRQRILKDIHDRIKNNLQNCQNEYRFRCADGSYKYVFDRGYILYDENKKPYRMIGAMTDVTEKKRLERELAEHQIKQHKLMTKTIIQTQEKERNELGRELHDNINQILATVKMYLGMVKAKDSVPVDLVGQSYEYVTEAMEEIRKLSHSLVTPSLGVIGLKEALQGLVENANLLNDLRVQLLFDEKYNEKAIDKDKELMLYRIVQEQMSNITKYARATNAVITLKTGDEILFLSIADDGVGFDVTQKRKGIGFSNISSRVEFYSGNMNIISAPGRGCSIEVFIPV